MYFSLNFHCWKLPRNFTANKPLSSLPLLYLQDGSTGIPHPCPMFPAILCGPFPLAKAAGPGCCSGAAGRPSPTTSRLRECILLVQIKKCKLKNEKGQCKDVFTGQYRSSLIIFWSVEEYRLILA